MKVEIAQTTTDEVEVIIRRTSNSGAVYYSHFKVNGPLDLDWVKETIADAYEAGVDHGRSSAGGDEPL